MEKTKRSQKKEKTNKVIHFVSGVLALFGHRGIDPLILSVFRSIMQFHDHRVRLRAWRITLMLLFKLPKKQRHLTA